MKLCVGAECVEDLADWQRSRFSGVDPVHVTRMWPRRSDELLAGGSLYWVFRGFILARQRVLRLDERLGEDGILRCALILDRVIVRTEPAPRRPFQGWRYLADGDCPRDLPRQSPGADALPAELVAAMAEMGVR